MRGYLFGLKRQQVTNVAGMLSLLVLFCGCVGAGIPHATRSTKHSVRAPAAVGADTASASTPTPAPATTAVPEPSRAPASFPTTAPGEVQTRAAEPDSKHISNFVTLFFATTRKPAPAGAHYSTGHPQYFTREWTQGSLTYGKVQVSIPVDPDHPEKSTLRDGVLDHITFFPSVADSMSDVWMYQPKKFPGADMFFNELTNEIPKHKTRNVLIAVHGFNNSFEFAGRRLAKMVFDLNYDGTQVLYSWPAGDSVGEYGVDLDYANQPKELAAFTDFLEAVVIRCRRAGAKEIQVFAHSMGNNLLRYAVNELAKRHPNEKLFDAAVLAAPDIPQEGFSEIYWPELRTMVGRCALYVANNDVAIFGSRALRGGQRRVGQWGKTAPLVLDGLETIDATNIHDTFLNHDYVVRAAGIRDLAAFLLKKESAAARIKDGYLGRPSKPPDAGWFELLNTSQ